MLYELLGALGALLLLWILAELLERKDDHE